ncbi:MAG: hypothetical protein UU03_C0016G0004 [Candidatus Woesebacteria bacterium GW2011_GWA1_40_45]|uniref:Uncharacterized protein n=5 Tax=Candidatus Woeseibacteriota TaxID=1752722 RepID=A0A0G0SDT3_9BACT|nr:MAG: hypothetical protein UU03_C0016G0004 [Candidatus Woesebacteria bacterium GW2011_GWA1_40_45]
MMDLAQIFSNFSPKFNLNLGNLSFSPSYLQAGIVLVLIFLLVLTMAQVRRHFIEWSFKGALFGIFFGFLLALILEGFLIVGGKTAITEIVGWKNAPQPILSFLDASRSQLVSVLGVSTEIPSSNAKIKTAPEEVLRSFQALSPSDLAKVKKLICAP